LSNPHNPGGTVWTEEELSRLAEICAENDVLVVSDEIHCDLVFEPHRYTPFANVAHTHNCLFISTIAPSKTFNLAGLSTSSVIIPDTKLRDTFATIIDTMHLTGGNVFGNIASEAAYSQGENWLSHLLDYVKKNIDYVENFIEKELPQINVMRPEASYLLWLDFRKLGFTPIELQQFLIEKARLGLNAGHTFGTGGEGFARMNLACPLSTVQEAMKRLKKAVSEM
jgi:cystathionine beta-lyase